MRLRSLALKRYGVFDDVRLELDPAPGKVNLILAPNGAGKSLLVNGFCDLLFGIHAQSPMDFRFDGYAEMRLSAEAEIAGASIAFSRRKGRGNTLADADGKPLDPQLMARWLGTVADRERLLALFALDSQRLRLAEGQLRDSDGALAEALLSGTGELHPIRELKLQLEQRRDAIGIPRGRSGRPLNAASAAWDDAGKRLRAAIQSPEQHAAQDRQFRNAVSEQEAAEQLHRAALAQLRRLGRLAVTQPAAAQRQAALAALAALPDLPILDPPLASRLAEAEAARVRCGDALATAQRAAVEAASRVASHVVATDRLAEAAAIDDIANRVGAVEKAARDTPGLDRDRAAARAAAGDLLRTLGHGDVAPDEAAGLVPARGTASAAQTSIARHATLAAALQDAADRHYRARLSAQDSAARLRDVSGRPAPPGLEALCSDTRANGSVTQRQMEAAMALDEAQAALSASLSRVPGWSDPAALIALAPPEQHTYALLHQALAATAEAARQNAAAMATRRAEHATRSDVLARMHAGGTPPGEALLAGARAHRDQGWALVRQRVFGGVRDAAAEAAYATLPLEEAVSQAIAAADAIADSRFAGATELAALRQAMERLTEAEALLAQSNDASAQAQAALLAAQTAWGDAARALKLTVSATMDEVHGVLGARNAAITARERLEQAQARVRQLGLQHAAWAIRLAAMLEAPAADLASLLSTADLRMREAAQFATTLATCRTTAEADAVAMRNAAADEAREAAALAGWRAEWHGHLAALGRPAGERPEVTAGLLSLFEELREHTHLIADRSARIDAIAADFTAFKDSLGLVQGRLGMQPSADPYVDSRALSAELAASRKAQALAEQEQAGARRAEALAEKARAALAGAETELHAVLAQCGADTAETARTRLSQSAARRDQMRRHDDAERVILAAGGGLAIDALLAEAASVPPDDLPAQRDAAEREAAGQADLAQRAAVRASLLRGQLAGDTAAEDVRIALSDQSAALATVERTAEEAIVLHLAAVMLDRALKRVEETRGDAGLARIGALFSRLTGGSYSKIEAVDIRGTAFLRAVDAAWPKERKSIRELSEGTRDQLCLALRLAAIEDHVKVSPVLPFIADDILQTFDDTRAVAAFGTLAEISQHVQVIVLTHHPHLAALAKGLPVHLQSLGS